MDRIIKNIKNRQAVIGIIGLGYVGLPLAREFLNAGFSVLGFDRDKTKVNKINGGVTYIKHVNSAFLKHFVIKEKKFYNNIWASIYW